MTKALTKLDAEHAFRAALAQMGSQVSPAKGSVRGLNARK
jgi:hypothetical protein